VLVVALLRLNDILFIIDGVYIRMYSLLINRRLRIGRSVACGRLSYKVDMAAAIVRCHCQSSNEAQKKSIRKAESWSRTNETTDDSETEKLEKRKGPGDDMLVRMVALLH
jgi:hypothetical protein